MWFLKKSPSRSASVFMLHPLSLESLCFDHLSVCRARTLEHAHIYTQYIYIYMARIYTLKNAYIKIWCLVDMFVTTKRQGNNS